ncbi:uncharacterized protein LOC122884903 isoform X2 [Siniperca chuatsi]|uniref:uncharacterized protein LOC122884903 isoform X2 n=1 Tax=Siniperca chuatsi TaxID=119488 RepID=UPI001CE0AFA3|nr:uncharacterized protein LOC122884903 isoform X2 [Siniperca chuatsi]
MASLVTSDDEISHDKNIFVKDISEIPELNQVSSCLWAQHKYDVGLIKDAEPVVITPKSSYRPCQNQYPLKKEAVDGIKLVFDSLLKAGVIIPCAKSLVWTPIFPVRKLRGAGEPQHCRFVQDLQAVNSAVHARAPTVPNPHTILSQVPPGSKWFSVVNLANAFFSIAVDPDSQYWFAFSFEDIVHGKGLAAKDKVHWTPEAEKAFVDLKLALQTPPTLGLPDSNRPFTQTVDERGGFMTSVLLQEHGGRLRPVGYFSNKLDPVAAGLPNCLKAVAAAEKAVIASRDIVGYADLTLLVPHAVSMILLEQKTSHLSTARWLSGRQ